MYRVIRKTSVIVDNLSGEQFIERCLLEANTTVLIGSKFLVGLNGMWVQL